MKKELLAKKTVKRIIILYELIGFGIVIALLWINEIYDFPHFIFGAARTPVNWIESVVESSLVLVLCVLTILLSWRCLERIKYLEKFVHVCVFCKRVRLNNSWVPIDQYIKDHSESTISHGLCSECMEKHYGLKGED